jgi:hypothetical protein
MSRSSPAQPKDGSTKSHALAEGLLLLAMLCLTIVTASRILTIEARSTPMDRALAPLSSARALTP